MTNFASKIIMALVIMVCFTSCDTGDVQSTGLAEKPVVYASFYPMYDFALKAAGDIAEVRCLIPDGTEVHDWEPSPRDIASLEAADLFVYSSGRFETWADTVISNINNEKLVTVEASEHAAYFGDDPHTWLSPAEARSQFEAICGALKRIDPENAERYAENEAFWLGEFDRLDEDFSVLRNLARKEILVTHAAFGHLCAAYGLEQISVSNAADESEPDPARMAEVVSIAAEHDITTVFYAELDGERLAASIAREIGAQTAPLSPVEGLTDAQRENGDDYFSVMRNNLASLLEALR